MAARVAFDRQDLSVDRPFEERPFFLGLTCLAGSFISSITGLGGGAIFVPLLLSLVKLPVSLISPYSNVAMTAASLVGLIPHFFVPGEFNLESSLAQNSFIGHVNALFILVLFTGAFFSSKLGVKLNSHVRVKTKKWLLTVLLFSLSLKILLGA